MNAQKAFIKRVIEEEEKLLRTLERGTRLFDEYVREHQKNVRIIDGQFAFNLYDRFGFPIDLTKVMAKEQGWSVDEGTFEALLTAQREGGCTAGEVKNRRLGGSVRMNGMAVFTGYETTEGTSQITRYRTLETAKGKVYRSYFRTERLYGGTGAAVGDTGFLRSANETLKALDTKKENDLIIHFVEELPKIATGEWAAEVDAERRRLIRANDSATHLLHAALRRVLGTHVEQKGSLVSDQILRFDFSHFQKMTDAEISEAKRIDGGKLQKALPCPSAGMSLFRRRRPWAR